MAIQAGDVIWNIRGDITDLNKALVASKQQISSSMGEVLALGQKVGAAMTIAGGGIVASLGASAMAATEFSKGLGLLNTLGVQDVQALGDGVLDVASRFGQDLQPTIMATYDLISSGVPEGNALDVLAESAKAAVAGSANVSEAVTLGTAVLNAFGLEAENVNVVFGEAFIAVNKGVTTFPELAAAVGQVAPTMAAAGLESKEMFASLAALTLGGVKTSEAATQMKAVLSGIIKPTSEAAKVAEELGIEFNVAALQSQGLQGFLQGISDAAGGNIEVLAQLFTSTEALGAVLSLTGNQADAFKATLDSMSQAQTATDEAFNKFMEANPAFAFDQLKSTIAALAVEIGRELLPMVIDFVRNAALPAIEAARAWVAENQPLVENILKVAAVIGGLMVALGPLLIVLPGIVSLFTAFSAVAAAVGVPLLAIGAAFAATAIGIGIAVGLIVVFWDEIKAAATQLWQWVTSAFQVGVEIVKGIFDLWVEWQRTKVQAIMGAFFFLRDGLANIWQGIVGIFQGAWNFISGIVESIIGAVRRAINMVGQLPGAGGGVPFIPGFATGGVTQHPLAIVGERGPELVAFPRGTRVMSNAEMRAAASGGGGGGVNVGAPNINLSVTVNGANLADARRIGNDLGDSLSRQMATQLQKELIARGRQAFGAA